MKSKERRPITGVEVRHRRDCATRTTAGACDCRPAFQGNVWSSRDGKRLRKTFATAAAAASWREDARRGLKQGTLVSPTKRTLRQAASEWVDGAKTGAIRTRSGDTYKPSALRGYERSLEQRILPELGGARLSDIRRADVQDIADRMLADGLDPSTIRNAVMPLRVLFRRAVSRGEVAVNPTAGLELPAVRGRRDRIASPSEAAELLDALPEPDQGIWATAMYAGLRRGELMALRWQDVDLEVGRISVERSWDEKDGAIEPKSAAGRRTVPIPAVLRQYLIAHRLRGGRTEGLVFGRTAALPMTPTWVRKRALSAWAKARVEQARTLALADGFDLDDLSPAEHDRYVARAGFEPLGLHEARHTFASLARIVQ